MPGVKTRTLREHVDHLYRDAPLLLRIRQRLRLVAAPMDAVLSHYPEADRALDIGCGGGLVLTFVAAMNKIKHGIGTDIDVGAIAAARIVAETHNLPIDFRVTQVGEALPDGTFDVVSMVDVLHHIDPAEQHAVFLEAAGRVAPGGRFFLKDIGTRPRWRAAMNTLHDLIFAQEWVHYVPDDQIARWAKEANLDIELSTSYRTLWYGHRLWVFRRSDFV